MGDNKITHCRLCKGEELSPILSLGNLALTGVFLKTKNAVPKAPLDLIKCENCHLVQLGQSVDPALLFGETYGYRSGLNQSMVRHLKGIVDDLFKKYPPKEGDLLLDIGSNDGTLLKSYPNPHHYQLLGVDPLVTKFKEFYPPHIETVADFFSMWSIPRKAKIVTSIAMLYDLEDPVKFAQHVSCILQPGGVWVFEVSYLPTVIEELAYDSICHEHLEYYSLRQLDRLMGEAGLKIIDANLNNCNGGSIAVTATHAETSLGGSSQFLDLIRMNETHLKLPTTYKDFAKRIELHKIELRSLLIRLKEEGKVVMGLGASTKGNVLLQYCGITPDLLLLIAEVNKEKIGCLTPGSEILISSEETVKSMADYLLVFPYHFRENIIQRERAYLEAGGKLIFPLPGKPTIVDSSVLQLKAGGQRV